MKRTLLTVFLIICVCLLVACKQDPPVSHDIVIMRIAKEEGTHHDYHFRYFHPVIGSEVYEWQAPDPDGYYCDWFRLPLNINIRVEVDGVDKGTFLVQSAGQIIYL